MTTQEARELAMLLTMLKWSIYGALLGLLMPIVAIGRASIKEGWNRMDVRNAVDSAKKGLMLIMAFLVILTGCLVYFNDAHTMVLYPARLVAAGSMGLFFGAGAATSVFEGTLAFKGWMARVKFFLRRRKYA